MFYSALGFGTKGSSDHCISLLRRQNTRLNGSSCSVYACHVFDETPIPNSKASLFPLDSFFQWGLLNVILKLMFIGHKI
ncbi:hypothetical protein CDL15_Pgr028813 [Punica granatum]|uniref:Uncharacterized protein n=1 Tax=Punica granatum TaxID=22663 RepID=A0A218VX89_PUNGR|nr:hypothetical protein CDL15_Pgr028813 [Punica granatum]